MRTQRSITCTHGAEHFWVAITWETQNIFSWNFVDLPTGHGRCVYTRFGLALRFLSSLPNVVKPEAQWRISRKRWGAVSTTRKSWNPKKVFFSLLESFFSPVIGEWFDILLITCKWHKGIWLPREPCFTVELHQWKMPFDLHFESTWKITIKKKFQEISSFLIFSWYDKLINTSIGFWTTSQIF